MRRAAVSALLPPLALLAGCATWGERPYAPIENVRYTAIGHDPFWLATIGDESIVLTLGDAGGRADGALETWAYPRVLPRTEDGVTRWESGEGAGVTPLLADRPASDGKPTAYVCEHFACLQPVTDPAKLAPWLYRLAATQALLYRRRRGRGRKLTDGYARRCRPTASMPSSSPR